MKSLNQKPKFDPTMQCNPQKVWKTALLAWSSDNLFGNLKINHLYRASIWCWESCSPGRSRKWRTLGYETTSFNCFCTWWYYPSFEIIIYFCQLSGPVQMILIWLKRFASFYISKSCTWNWNWSSKRFGNSKSFWQNKNVLGTTGKKLFYVRTSNILYS